MANFISSISDDRLFSLCKNYGQQAKIWKQKFMGLLPEVYRRKLFEKKGYQSIFDFALLMAGISEEQVRRTLSLENFLSDKPELHKLLITGEVSVNKLSRVASIATTYNQQELASKVKCLPQKALEMMVRDERRRDDAVNQAAKSNERKLWAEYSSFSGNRSGYYGSLFIESQNQGEDKSASANAGGNCNQDCRTDEPVRAHNPDQPYNQSVSQWEGFDVDLNKDLPLLRSFSPELKQKLHEMMQKGIDLNEILLKLIALREWDIEERKRQLSVESKEKVEAGNASVINTNAKAGNTAPPHSFSRYISIKIRRLLKDEFGQKCVVPGCNKAAKVIHHANRFSLSKSHDPRYLAPLCREHHVLAHSLDLKFAKKLQKA